MPLAFPWPCYFARWAIVGYRLSLRMCFQFSQLPLPVAFLHACQGCVLRGPDALSQSENISLKINTTPRTLSLSALQSVIASLRLLPHQMSSQPSNGSRYAGQSNRPWTGTLEHLKSALTIFKRKDWEYNTGNFILAHSGCV